MRLDESSHTKNKSKSFIEESTGLKPNVDESAAIYIADDTLNATNQKLILG